MCTVSLRRLQLCFSRWEALIRAALYIIDTLDETQNSLKMTVCSMQISLWDEVKLSFGSVSSIETYLTVLQFHCSIQGFFVRCTIGRCCSQLWSLTSITFFSLASKCSLIRNYFQSFYSSKSLSVPNFTFKSRLCLWLQMNHVLQSEEHALFTDMPSTLNHQELLRNIPSSWTCFLVSLLTDGVGLCLQ